MSRFSRRSFLRRSAVVLPALAVPGWAMGFAQRVPRIGFLSGAVPSLVSAFETEIRKLGLVSGKNLLLEMRLSRPNTDDLAKHAAELAAMDLDLVVAGALPQALAVRTANPAMPMVIATCPGMVSNGFAQSLDHPGGIYTGIDELPPGVTARRMDLLNAAAPTHKRIALLSTTPGRGGHETQLADAEAAARRLGVAVKPYRAASFDELRSALTACVADGMEALLNFQGGLSLANRQLIVEFAAQRRLPAIYQSAFFVEAGGLMAWAPDQEEQYRIAARYAAKIIRGAKPGDLPVVYPPGYQLSVNTTAARTLGLTLPASLLAKATRVTG